MDVVSGFKETELDLASKIIAYVYINVILNTVKDLISAVLTRCFTTFSITQIIFTMT
ncbi:MAG: hypothetical protein FJY65_08800 [Calditrichaeota bacterium]|nr:hypothetical protein [Calditrichota bacterium]